MLPLRDDNPTSLTPIVTLGLIVVCTVVHVYKALLPHPEAQGLILGLGTIPAVISGDAILQPELALVPPLLSLLTAMFVHGDILHLGGNLLYLWIFGNNVEDAMGHLRFLAFYLICGVAAALLHIVQAPGSPVPMVGASGAISGVLGAYLILFPFARVFVWFGFVFMFWVPALVVLGLWFGLQALNVLADPTGAASGVAWWAHLGGFGVGMLLTPLLRRRGFPLFSRRSRVTRVSLIPRAGRGSPRRRGPWDPPG